ncbi:MAG: transcription termination factor Rho [Actinomycetaceae bacterium]|nr:transcription termination factor Rho [Actinomycetaceae bacterium]
MSTIDFSPRALHALKLPELRALAKEKGVRRISTLRKPELVSALLELNNVSTASQTQPDEDTSAEIVSDLPSRNEESNDGSTNQAVDAQTLLSQEDTASSDDPPIKRRRIAKATIGARRVRREAKAPQQEPEQPVLDIREELKVDLDVPERDTSDSKAASTVKIPEIELPERGREQERQSLRVPRERKRRIRDDRGRQNKNWNNQESRGSDRGSERMNDRNGERNGERESSAVALEEDVLLPIAGILDIQPNHAFVRTSGYLPGPNDIYVTLGQVRRWSLRSGDAIVGAVRPRNEAEPVNRRQKYNALVRLDTVNGMSIDEARQRKEFKALTPLYPQEQLRLETSAKSITQRTIDLVAPIGKGQRGLIVSPPKAGKTIILQQIANAITQNNPECHLMVVLVDERPEEVTDMQRTVKGEIIASTFDRPASDHTTVAELAIERAKRLVELDQDVVVLLDSITRLGRAYNIAAPASGRILSGGVDASALYPPKKFFGAARNVENGGSLTILATALVETGSKMDEVIFEEFKGTGNMELRLSRELADKRIFPAVDVNASGTRREELLLTKEELAITWKLRRMMGSLESTKATEFVLSKLKDTSTNAEFLMALAKMTPAKD